MGRKWLNLCENFGCSVWGEKKGSSIRRHLLVNSTEFCFLYDYNLYSNGQLYLSLLRAALVTWQGLSQWGVSRNPLAGSERDAFLMKGMDAVDPTVSYSWSRCPAILQPCKTKGQASLVLTSPSHWINTIIYLAKDFLACLQSMFLSV